MLLPIHIIKVSFKYLKFQNDIQIFSTVLWITVHAWQSGAVILHISTEYFPLDQVVGMYFIL